MKWLVTLLVVPFLVGCGKYSTGEFQPYVDTFIQADPQHRPITNLVIKYGETDNPENTGATCIVSDGLVAPTIIVNEELWQTLDDTTKEMVMLHELGHCILGRKHTAEHIAGQNRPPSLMAPAIFQSPVYLQYKTYYWTELFSYGDGQ